MDPLEKSYPWNSPYAFSENVVIDAIEFEGLEKYKIVGRSFAPTGSFTNSHFDSEGDNRIKFEAADYKEVSARIHIQVIANMDNLTLDKKIDSQPTIDMFGLKWDIDNQALKAQVSENFTISQKNKHISGYYYAQNGQELGPPIDIQFKVSLTIDEGILNVSAKITGNVFPAQETVLFDESGKGVFIGTSTAKGGPMTDVWGQGKDNNLSNIDFQISIDDAGNFKKIIEKDSKGNLNEVSIEDWNKRFSDKKVWNKQDDKKYKDQYEED